MLVPGQTVPEFSGVPLAEKKGVKVDIVQHCLSSECFKDRKVTKAVLENVPYMFCFY